MIAGRCQCGELRYEAGVEVYRSSETIDRYFCGRCGSQLMCVFKPEPDLVYLTMGTVDGNPPCPPVDHQFAGSRAPWHEITDGLPQHEAWPDE